MEQVRKSRFLEVTALVFIMSLFAPVITVGASLWSTKANTPLNSWAYLLVLLLATMVLATFLVLKSHFIQSNLLEDAERTAKYIDLVASKNPKLTIILSATLSLLIELCLIRWQGTQLEFFAFYKNFGLLSCFAGLGLGYALSSKKRIYLNCTIPLLLWQIVLLSFIRYGLPVSLHSSIRAIPFVERLSMDVKSTVGLTHFISIYFFIGITFCLTAIALIPIGQLCGRAMEKEDKLRAYSFNLIGSILGVAIMLGLSLLWTPPTIWFALAFLPLLYFLQNNTRTLFFGVLTTLLSFIALSWPNSFSWEKIYSPYQIIERGQGTNSLMLIKSSGHYYQKVHDFSYKQVNNWTGETKRSQTEVYLAPYRLLDIKAPENVLIVGSGTGNDVAAALAIDAKQITAVEIDPAIMKLGELYHPNKPYSSNRVRKIRNDARTFIRTNEEQFDLIVYGLLDSHTLLSHTSSVRLDSFVYTVEALKETRNRLKPGAILSLSFYVLSPELGRKIFLMMQEAFDGNPPISVKPKHGKTTFFFQSKEGDLSLSPRQIDKVDFHSLNSKFLDDSLRADISTDDWPFLYMPQRVYPKSYLWIIALMSLLVVAMVSAFIREKPSFGNASFFFLGAGFMLVETKAITELGLVFGNTWYVIGIVIIFILAMALLANYLVQWCNIKSLTPAFLFLFLALMLGYLNSGGHSSTVMGRTVAAVTLTSPLFFSGIVFSSLLKNSQNISGAMALNLIGALCGGLMEYNSMYFGFRFLYILAFALYLAAFVFSLHSFKRLHSSVH